MGNAKRRKETGNYPEKTEKPKEQKSLTEAGREKLKKFVELSNQDIIASFVVSMCKRGWIPLILMIPDDTVHPQGVKGVYGAIADTNLQVAILREFADEIEHSVDVGNIKENKEPLIKLA